MLNEKQVLEIVPVGRTTLYRMVKAGRFPRPTYISPNRRVWFEDEIICWQNAVDERIRTVAGAKGGAAVSQAEIRLSGNVRRNVACGPEAAGQVSQFVAYLAFVAISPRS